MLADPPTAAAPAAGYTIDARGLIVRRRLTYAEWEACYLDAYGRRDGGSWALYDAIIYGEDQIGEEYAQAIRATQLNYGSLRNGVYINRRFPRAARRYAVSRSHYATVAPLPDALASALLERAEREGATHEELRVWKQAVSRPCPVCRKLMLLDADGQTFRCTNPDCGATADAKNPPPRPVTVEGQVFYVGGETDGYVRIAVPLDAAGAETLRVGQTVRVTFTPAASDSSD